MTQEEVQDIVGNLGQTISAQAIDLAVAHAKISRLERENAELRAKVETSD